MGIIEITPKTLYGRLKMSISLKEVIEGAGYNFNDTDDLYKIQSMLTEAEELAEEVEDQLDQREAEETLRNKDWF